MIYYTDHRHAIDCTITCDQPGCSARRQETATTYAEALDTAASAGWKRGQPIEIDHEKYARDDKGGVLLDGEAPVIEEVRKRIMTGDLCPHCAG